MPPVARLSWNVVFPLILSAAAGGCTHANQRLNDPGVQLERRAGNRTFAATAVNVAPIHSEDTQRVRPEGGESAGGDDTSAAARGQSPDVRPDGYFVGLALSGGGSRSANFSAACMFQLQRLGMLQHVDYISSVSGGSLTAAYYCLHGDNGWNPGRVQKKLTHSFATDLIVGTLIPWNMPVLWFSDWDRSDLLSDSFASVLFSRKGRELTFKDLRADRPRLLINATDLQTGRRFIFCNETFDELNSDLSKYPVADAVAASAAVPVLLHHVTLRDFSTRFKQYRHLVDGGVADNLGVQTLAETYTAQLEAAAKHNLPDPYPRGAVLIVIDARTEYDARLSHRGDVTFFESLSTGAGLTSTVLLNRASSATLAELVVQNANDNRTAGEIREDIDELERTGGVTLEGRNGKPVRIIHLALSHVDDLSTLPHHSFHEHVNNISTYFNISSEEAFNLYEAAELLVREQFEAHLASLAREIGGEGDMGEPERTEATPTPQPVTKPSP